MSKKYELTSVAHPSENEIILTEDLITVFYNEDNRGALIKLLRHVTGIGFGNLCVSY